MSVTSASGIKGGQLTVTGLVGSGQKTELKPVILSKIGYVTGRPGLRVERGTSR